MKNIKNVGVIGSGLMGTEIAMVFAQHQYKVVLIDKQMISWSGTPKEMFVSTNTKIQEFLIFVIFLQFYKCAVKTRISSLKLS